MEPINLGGITVVTDLSGNQQGVIITLNEDGLIYTVTPSSYVGDAFQCADLTQLPYLVP